MTPLPAGTAVQADSPGQYLALPAQRGMILNYLRFPGDDIDVIQVTLDWDTPLEPEPFEAACPSIPTRFNSASWRTVPQHQQLGVLGCR